MSKYLEIWKNSLMWMLVLRTVESAWASILTGAWYRWWLDVWCKCPDEQVQSIWAVDSRWEIIRLWNVLIKCCLTCHYNGLHWLPELYYLIVRAVDAFTRLFVMVRQRKIKLNTKMKIFQAAVITRAVLIWNSYLILISDIFII